ncbi:MAG: hypothetical protein ACRYGC_17590 [Janthinobacterium lividum]
MTQGPTTENGPLHTPEATLDDRSMTATFRSMADAESARAALLAAGFADGSVTLAGGASGGVQHAVAAPDQSLLGRLREAVLPDDSTTALRDAASNDETVLTLRPEAAQVEDAIRIIQAANPHHFDAALERWRNAG